MRVQGAAGAVTAAVDNERSALLQRENALLAAQSAHLEAEVARLQGASDGQLERTLHLTEECAALAGRLQAKEAEGRELMDWCVQRLLVVEITQTGVHVMARVPCQTTCPECRLCVPGRARVHARRRDLRGDSGPCV